LNASEPRLAPTLAAAARVAARTRLCALTRQECAVDDLIRFVRGPDGSIAPDLSGKLGGRGIWISATRLAVAEAARRNVFSKSLKSNVKASENLAELVEQQLRERMRQALSFAAKAGLVTSGYTKVDEALATGRVAVLLQASDAADDGAVRLRSKFEGLARTRGRPAPVIRQFTSDELSMALGRTNVVHASLADGGQTSAFLRESLRLERFRLNDGTRSASLPDMQSGSAGGLDTGNV
jgi:uncharacterized protein